MYHTTLYMLQCQANATALCRTRTFDTTQGDSDCEDQILSSCPFALLDVGYAAALSRSDTDLLKIAEILTESGETHYIRPSQKDFMLKWKEQSERVLAEYLWDAQHQTFLSRSVVFQRVVNETFQPNSTEVLVFPVADSFIPWWNGIEDPSTMSSMAFQLLQSDGDFSFNCGSFALWSSGGCNGHITEDKLRSSVRPLVNYFISRGMSENANLGIGQFLSSSALNLVCGVSNTIGSNQSDLCSHEVSFHGRYNGELNLPFGTDACTTTSTETAAVIYNLAVPDTPFHYTPFPPIGSSWVITLIIAELVVAFSIGVSCLIFSLNLMRRLKSDGSGDNVFASDINSPLLGDAGYFSAAESVASDTKSIGPEVEEEESQNMTWSGASPFKMFSGSIS